VVDSVEDALTTIEGVKSISSRSQLGQASITLEFELERDINAALQDVQAKVAQAQRRLPVNVEPPVISKTNPDDNPILWLALTYDKNDLKFMMTYARDYLKDRFSTISGVGDVFLGGYVAPQLRVWVQHEALKKNNITVNDIIDAIQSEHVETPGGVVETEKKNYNVRTYGTAKSVEEFKDIVISKRAGQQMADPTRFLRLGQVSRVEEGLDEIERLSRFQGQRALGIGVRKQRGANAVQVAQAVKKQLLEIQKDLPEGMEIHVNFDSTKFIEQSVHELNKHLIIAIILTSLICWVFLGSWAATFNVILAIPTSILGAFIGLYFLGFTLNTFTLLGLTLAIGIVVDDAIMVLENIFRYNQLGNNRIRSAILGSREIAFAAMAATAAVIAIFLPVVFMKGIIGKFFMQFGVAISLAVAFSLLESLTITPMRSAMMLSNIKRTSTLGLFFETTMSFLEKIYHRTLKWSLKHRWIVLFSSLLLFVFSLMLIKVIKKEMSPSLDQSLFMVRLSLPQGSSLKYTDQQTRLAEAWFKTRPEVRAVYASVGGFGGGASSSNSSMMFVTLKEKSDRPKDPEKNKVLSQEEIMGLARQNLSKIPDISPVVIDLSMRGFSSGKGFPIEFKIVGPNWEKLAQKNFTMIEKMKSSGLMVDVESNYDLGLPEIGLYPDRDVAASHGLSMTNIGKTVNSLIGGVIVGQYIKDGRRYDIRLMIEKNENPMNKINSLSVGNVRANLIPLENVISIKNQSSLQSIQRINRQRAITITANLAPGISQTDAASFITKESEALVENGYRIEMEGASKSNKESLMGLLFAMGMGFLVAYMILGAQFNSFLDPISVMMALFFSITGAFLALKITNQSLNMYSMIGILLLMGIAKKNSILLVEFTNQIRHQKKLKVRDALEEACPIRLRPILMTSLSTVAGALPSAMAMGAGAESYRPMAIAIIGGVLVSTVLTLYVVPVVYLLLERFRKNDQFASEVEKAFEGI